jgi:hypothetical protein
VAWIGNRVIHLPSQLNRIDQMDPTLLAQYGPQISECQYTNSGGKTQASVLTDTFGPGGCADADGLGNLLPYANYVNDFGGSATVAQALVPYPQYSYIFNNFEAKGTAYYQSAQIEIDKRFSNGLAFLTGYTLSHLMDNTSSGFSSFANGGINKYNQKPEWAISNADEPQTLKVSGTYELPIGPKKKFFNNRGVTGQILGGFQVGWILNYQAGTANGVGQNGPSFPNGFQRPARNSGVKLGTASYNRERDYFVKQQGQGAGPDIFNPAAFSTVAAYILTDTKRNFTELRNPAYANEAFNARKKFFFGERFTGLLQVDYFNAFNRTLFNGPDNNASDTAFGTATSKGSNLPNRQGQASFRLEF